MIERDRKGSVAITKMARSLAEQTTFPDLEGWEDSEEKKRQAKGAVQALREYLDRAERDLEQERARQAARRAFEAAQQTAAEQRNTLEKLAFRLNDLASGIGAQDAGYKFQDWFYDLSDYFEVESRRPYTTNGRQIDGSLTIEGTTYLVELKFCAAQAPAPEVDVFRRKVESKADNTMGIMISMSGFSPPAIDSASGPRTPILLLDYSHLYYMLSGSMTLTELVSRVRRHASQTSQALLPVSEFNG